MRLLTYRFERTLLSRMHAYMQPWPSKREALAVKLLIRHFPIHQPLTLCDPRCFPLPSSKSNPMAFCFSRKALISSVLSWGRQAAWAFIVTSMRFCFTKSHSFWRLLMLFSLASFCSLDNRWRLIARSCQFASKLTRENWREYESEEVQFFARLFLSWSDVLKLNSLSCRVWPSLTLLHCGPK